MDQNLSKPPARFLTPRDLLGAIKIAVETEASIPLRAKASLALQLNELLADPELDRVNLWDVWNIFPENVKQAVRMLNR